jgi:hypothetical protein
MIEMAIRGRNAKLITDTLTVGTIVRLKGEDWFCSLEVDDCDLVHYFMENKNRLLKTDKKLVFNSEMAKLLGKRLEVVDVRTRDNGYGEWIPCYKMKTVDGIPSRLTFTFINEMLELD